jgi:large subunit ribosomal protein L9
MKYHVLLLEDVTNHGRKGELAFVAPGFARNYLLPQGKAILATYATVKTQNRLKEERDAQAKIDRAVSEKIANELKGKSFSKVSKVDSDGHMYGSVSAKDIAEMLFNEGINIEKKHVVLHLPIRSLGKHSVPIKLPEGVMVTISLEIVPDRIIEKKKKAKSDEAVVSLDETIIQE